MIFSSTFAVLLTLWSTASTSTASGAILNAVHPVRTTFVLRSNVHMTMEEQLFTADCLKLSFDNAAAALKSDQVKMELAELQTATRLPAPRRMLHDSAGSEDTSAFQWVFDWTTRAACPSCQATTTKTLHETLSPELHNQWEAEFCATLRSGPFAVFHDVDSCQIVSSSSTVESTGAPKVVADLSLVEAELQASEFATLTSNQELIFNARVSFGLPLDDDTTDEEQIFINECFRLSYDELHDDEDIHMESAELRQHFSVPHEKDPTTLETSAAEATAPYNPSRWMNHGYSYVWAWQVTGLCNLCFGSLLAHGIELTDARKGNRKEQERWEDAFCDKIRAGPFDKYKNVKDCYIAIFREG